LRAPNGRHGVVLKEDKIIPVMSVCETTQGEKDEEVN
jgi:hypothetical protein